jgi:RHS repeat-associated protein
MRRGKVTGYGGPSPTASYYLTDALGSTRLLTDSSANVQFYDNYQPYGQDNLASGSETYKFTGKPFSQTTGLYYYYHRWYDPTIGRFISPDPKHGHLSNPQSLNLYIYVLDLPTGLTDPTGTDACNWNPFTRGGCANNVYNAGASVVNTAVTDTSAGVNAVVDKWNNDANFRTIVISIAVIAVVAVATGGLGLAVTPVLIGGLSGAGISGAFYGATCGSAQGGCSLEGFEAAALSGGALGALGGVAGPLAEGAGVARLGLTGISAAAFTRGVSGGILAGAQVATDIGGSKSTSQIATDAFIAFGFGAATGTKTPMGSADIYSTTSLAREFSYDVTARESLLGPGGDLESGVVSGVWDDYLVPYLGL